MAVEYQDVTSSNIRALGFEKGVGYIWFSNGRRFAYTMSEALFTQMKTAASIGSFFARAIKKQCPVVWAGWGCDNSPCRSNAVLIGTVRMDATTGDTMKFRVCEPCSKIARYHGIEFAVIPPESSAS